MCRSSRPGTRIQRIYLICRFYNPLWGFHPLQKSPPPKSRGHHVGVTILKVGKKRKKEKSFYLIVNCNAVLFMPKSLKGLNTPPEKFVI